MSIRIRGEFPDFGRAAAKARAGVELETVRAAFDLVAEMKRNVPVRSGALRSSISGTVKGGKAEVGPTAFYARFVELGTARMAPQPFVIPAAERIEPQYRKAIEQVGRKAIE